MKSIGFDFDGTLIISEQAKGPAMVEVFREKFKVVRGVKKTYESLIGKGYTRDMKVIELFKKFFKREPTEKELKVVADHFGEHYVNSMKTCPLFECIDVLKRVRKKYDYMFLLSLENVKEVKKLAKHCGIAKYFDEILGGPTSKVEHLKQVLKKHSEGVVYVGDAHSDVKAARKMGVKMILIGKKHRNNEADKVIKSLCDLEKVL